VYDQNKQQVIHELHQDKLTRKIHPQPPKKNPDQLTFLNQLAFSYDQSIQATPTNLII